MVNWQELNISTDLQSWENFFNLQTHKVIFQNYLWGDYKSQFGWKPYRFLKQDPTTKETVAQIQILVKIYSIKIPLLWTFKCAVIWIPGITNEISKHLDSEFINYLKLKLNIKKIYLRTSIFSAYSNLCSVLLRSLNWQRAIAPIISGMSMEHNLKNDLAILEKNMSSNWRHNLKRGLNKNISIQKWENPNVAEMMSIYKNMENLKDLEEQFSANEIEKLLYYFKDNLVIFRSLNEKNETIAFRGCIIWGNNGFDFFAAANEEARKIYASHVLLWEILKYCKQKNVAHYDMCGIDPINGKGVYNFKRGSGASELEYMGEWESSTSIILKLLINWKIARNNKKSV
ncbi:peptidoglycan bridge formation glycyltransferase FemA/FemB family protein [Pigmentibacter ruber]|uniref:peptidoglycan bridge formation glycyltransferase FemA/FemB family protein n=1 Tax=Pigmentibacter ruber TaxID=2683196 RepID=UPI00131E44AC|nr:peptidoglycan bridge formation glycyltransferase FemA/FemB family protein [Pigmentibacter ruber]BFD31230.1 hypothetical protein GTC16762_08480 [Pigmentibacter ruber]